MEKKHRTALQDQREALSLMRFMISWSGGKDSTASIILAHEHREPLDEIIFCEVM